MLVPDPVLVEVFERVEEAGRRELGRPDGVDHGEVRRDALGHRMSEHLMEGFAWNREDADLVVLPRRVADHVRPRAFRRDDDADLRLIGSAAQPVRVHERPAAPVAQDDPFLGELGERAGHGCPADPVPIAQLVLGRQTVLRPVAPAEDLLQKQRLELEVDRDRLCRIDRHPSPQRPHSTGARRCVCHSTVANGLTRPNRICYRRAANRATTRGAGDGGLELDVAADPIAKETSLANRALAVLDANWLGSGTSPSRRLYPHQWSWDAACIAMGQASWNQERADTELRSLFAGQWRNGLLPHIVFTEQTPLLPGTGVLAVGAKP